jgi:hypothetical protein
LQAVKIVEYCLQRGPILEENIPPSAGLEYSTQENSRSGQHALSKLHNVTAQMAVKLFIVTARRTITIIQYS